MNLEEMEARTLVLLEDAKKNGDIERAHGDADDALCELLEYLGFKEIVEAWKAVPKWCA